MIGIFTSRNQAHEITCFWTPYMVSQMLQSSTTCTFIVNNLYICQKRCIYIRRYIIVFNNTHFKKNIFLQLQPKIISFNNICWTSTKISFIQQQYSFNLNQNCFHSTKIFVQLQPKLISFNNNVCSTSTKIIFIQELTLTIEWGLPCVQSLQWTIYIGKKTEEIVFFRIWACVAGAKKHSRFQCLRCLQEWRHLKFCAVTSRRGKN